MISIIIPTFNEQDYMQKSITNLQKVRKFINCEIILVDGSSVDSTVDIAMPYVDKILLSLPQRSFQQNLGAFSAKGNILLFQHVDTEINIENINYLNQYKDRFDWGFFKIKLNNNDKKFRFLENCINLRSNLFNYATGDQNLFIKTEIFKKIGGFPRIDIMEDIEICKKLKKLSNPLQISSCVSTSARKWENEGFVKTIIKMRILRILNACNINTKILKRLY